MTAFRRWSNITRSGYWIEESLAIRALSLASVEHVTSRRETFIYPFDIMRQTRTLPAPGILSDKVYSLTQMSVSLFWTKSKEHSPVSPASRNGVLSFSGSHTARGYTAEGTVEQLSEKRRRRSWLVVPSQNPPTPYFLVSSRFNLSLHSLALAT